MEAWTQQQVYLNLVLKSLIGVGWNEREFLFASTYRLTMTSLQAHILLVP